MQQRRLVSRQTIPPPPGENQTNFDYTVLSTSYTSAGVFTEDGTLIRTLWSNEIRQPGAYNEAWDGYDNNGNLAADGTYEVKVLSNDVQYQWEGTIGNSSDSMTGATRHRGGQGIFGMAISDTSLYFCMSYSEGWSSDAKTSTNNTGKKSYILPVAGTDQSTEYVTTDDNYVYWAGYDAYNKGKSFVFATKVSDDTQATLSSGSSYKCAHGVITYTSAIDQLYVAPATSSSADQLIALNTTRVTGMAVQKSGSYLFVSHKGMDELHVLNKTTGALVRTISITTPTELTVDASDNLWMASGTNTVTKYTVNVDGTLTSVISVSGLLAPLAMAVKPTNDSIYILDGSSNQIMRTFSSTTGAEGVSFGRVGGYQMDATVYNDKFYFVDRAGQEISNTFRACIAFQSDGSFWIGDGGNYRALHFTANRTYLDYIMWQPMMYSVAVDPNNITRVFANWMEFQVDYSKPIAAKNGSWKLVKNWRDGVTSTSYEFNSNVLEGTVTLDNGKTYSTIFNNGNNQITIVELPSTGNLRFTGQGFSGKGTVVTKLNADGSLGVMTRGVTGAQTTFAVKPLTGFDGSNNPIWGSEVTQSSLLTVTDDPFTRQGNTYKITDDLIISYDASNADTSFDPDRGLGSHLGVIKRGTNDWLWKGAKATFDEYIGDFPADDAFDVGNSVKFPGGNVYALGDNILTNFRGENWKNSQTNKWNHYWKNGLMVAQFGTTSPEHKGEIMPAENAGNVLNGALVQIADTMYVWHGEESPHSGMHRWKVTGLETIHIDSFAVVKVGIPAVIPQTGNLMAGLTRNTVLVSGSNGWTRTPTPESTNNVLTDYWTVKSGLATYDPFRPSDIYIRYAQPAGTTPGTPYYVSRDLGTNNTSNWTIEGKLTYNDRNTPNTTDGKGGQYLDILDNTGKVIVRFYLVQDATDVYVYANSTIIAQGTIAAMNLIIRKGEPFKIQNNSGVITVSYALYDPVTVSVYEVGANANRPNTLKNWFFTNTGTTGSPRSVDIEAFKFQ